MRAYSNTGKQSRIIIVDDNCHDITSGGCYWLPKPGVMYGKDRKQYQSLKLVCGSDVVLL